MLAKGAVSKRSGNELGVVGDVLGVDGAVENVVLQEGSDQVGVGGQLLRSRAAHELLEGLVGRSEDGDVPGIAESLDKVGELAKVGGQARESGVVLGQGLVERRSLSIDGGGQYGKREDLELHDDDEEGEEESRAVAGVDDGERVMQWIPPCTLR